MIFDLTDDDRDALERLRAARGARSSAEVLRALIRENTADGEFVLGIVHTPTGKELARLVPVANPVRLVKGDVAKPRPVKSRLKGEWKAP